MQPKEALRKLCTECLGMDRFNAKFVHACDGDTAQNGGCPLYPYRLGRPNLRAFRKYCVWCMGGSSHAVDNCETHDCPLHPFRYGKNPHRSGIGGVPSHRSKSTKGVVSPVKNHRKGVS